MPHSPKPSILFSCGAFHKADYFDAVKQRLEAAQFYPVLVSTHPSLGSDSRGKTLWDDVQAMQAQMTPYVDAGCEFIVVGHSYGGFPAFALTRGWTVAERAATGKKGGIKSVVFHAAAVPLVPGGTAIGVFEEGKEHVYPPFFDHGPQGQKGQLIYPNATSKPSFYNDMSTADADHWESLLVPHSQDAIETPVDYTVADAHVPYYYIINEKDATVPPEIQRSVAAAIPNCTTLSIDSGHTPFITQPDRFVALLQDIAKEAFAAEN